MSCPGDNYIVPSADPCNQGGGGGGAVTSIVAGGGINLDPVSGLGDVTINAAVTSIIAGSNITVDPPTGIGAVTIAGNAGVDSINSCLGNISLEAGNSSLTVTTTPGPGSGVISLVANFPVTTLTGVGAAVVSQPNPGEFEVSVAPGNTNSLNTYISSIGQTTGFDLPYGGPPQYIAIDLPGSFPTASLPLYSFVDIEVNVNLQGTGAQYFGGGSCQFGFIWTSGPITGVPATLEYSGTVNPLTINPYSFTLGFIRIPTSQFIQPPGATDLSLYIANTATNPTVLFSIESFASKHRVTLTN